MKWLQPVISSVCYSLAEPWQLERENVEGGVAFVRRQMGRLPGYLRLAILLLTAVINLAVFLFTGRPLEAHAPDSRRRILGRLERYGLGPFADWFRFYRILMALYCHREGPPL